MALALTAQFVAHATGGRLEAGDSARVFAEVSTDSRRLTDAEARARTLFIALSGPNFDGHQFAAPLLAAGAAGVMVSAPVETTGAGVVIRVDDTLAALQRLATAVRRASRARVVAITGSAGKTTTKELTADVLAANHRVFRNAGNLNNHIGLPLSLLELRHGAEIAVVELGMNHAGEIRRLVEIAEPDVRVWTNVGDAHIGYFGTRDAIADAKAEILEHASASTVLVANGDDPLIAARLSGFAGRTMRFGVGDAADVRAIDIVDRGFDGTESTVLIGGARTTLRLRLPGRANVMNALAAAAVAANESVSVQTIADRLAQAAPVARRGEVRRLANGARIVDDSYNASPAAMMLALESLAATPAERRIAALGEMRELGDLSRGLHDACGAAAAAAGVSLLAVVGGADADGLASGALRGGLAADRILRFATSAEAAEVLPGLVRADDVVLVKGSRGTRMDVVADRFKEMA